MTSTLRDPRVWYCIRLEEKDKRFPREDGPFLRGKGDPFGFGTSKSAYVLASTGPSASIINVAA